MKILKTITDLDLGLKPMRSTVTRERRASRAVVFDKDGNVALLDATLKNYHKLPGGGIEENEDFTQALKRECKEEIGCDVEVSNEIGIVEEYGSQTGFHQLSYCFMAKVVGEKGLSDLEDDEASDGFKTVWVSLDKAIEILASETGVYEGKFIQVRDLCILQEAKRILSLK